jgi:ribosomal protein L11 methyltransferase
VSAVYWALTVRLASEASDGVANFLSEAGATGVVEEGEVDAIELRAFFPPGTDPVDVRGRLLVYLEALRALAVPVGPGAVRVTEVPDEAWADAWRAYFRPLPIGRRLLVCPPWEAPDALRGRPDGSRLVLLIEPGRAFGTGSHATTRGCLELLERALAATPAARVLDVGAGSGILAIAAARLGAASVVALDLDPDAVAATTANAARNAVADRVRAEIGSPEQWAGPPAELVVANLLASALVGLAPALAGCVTAPGRLIAGGLLAHEVPAVVGTFVAEGFRLVELVEHEGWASLLLQREAA